MNYEEKKTDNCDLSIIDNIIDSPTILIVGESSFYRLLSERILELSELNGSIALTPVIISKTKMILNTLPFKYLKYLKIDNGIYATSYGTITIEWRPNDDNVLSIEIGQNTSNFYAIINDEIIKPESNNEIQSIYCAKMEYILQKMCTFYYAAPHQTSFLGDNWN